MNNNIAKTDHDDEFHSPLFYHLFFIRVVHPIFDV